ncbi:MAG: class I SAM-dependent methyltransferase, partial [Alphaproteobacteria bacterium]
NEIVYLDISSTSSSIAKKRAQKRKLNNIRWLEGSILDLPEMDLGSFDYINCSGVLHHLENPALGLRALESILADDGAIGVMVYGKYGRTAVYQIQELMRLVNGDETDMSKKVINTSKILEYLPPTNWFRSSSDSTTDHKQYGDTGIFDLFLHAVDRAFTIPELYQWIEGAGLELIEFAQNRHFLDPFAYIRDEKLLATIKSKPVRVQQAIAELMSGYFKKHVFYCGRSSRCVADLRQPNMVPFLWTDKTHLEAFEELNQGNESSTVFQADSGSVTISAEPLYATLFKHIDGIKTVDEIIGAVRRETSETGVSYEQVLDALENFYIPLNLFNLMCLRHKNVPPYLNRDQLQSRAFGTFSSEPKPDNRF